MKVEYLMALNSVVRAEPLIIVGGGVGQNREKKGSGSVSKKKKSKCLVG